MLLRRGARDEKIPQVRTVGTRWEPAHPFLKQVRKVGTSSSVLVRLDVPYKASKTSARPVGHGHLTQACGPTEGFSPS